MALHAVFAASAVAATPSLNTVATFNNTNGKYPQAGLIADAAGNLYGTTNSGGSSNYYGTVFKIDVGTHALSTVVSFNNANGANPQYGRLMADAAGNLYGTTYGDGSSTQGTIFEISAGSNDLTTLIAFNGANGANPAGGLISDASGNLYGTTYLGGSSNLGTVFKVGAGTNTLTTLFSFSGSNGKRPIAGLIADASGNLYGTTSTGGTFVGTAFKFAVATDTLSTLAAFTGFNGNEPFADLIADAAGNLYGTTLQGGSNNDGNVFKIAAGTNILTTLVTFNDTNGKYPYAGVIADAAGNLYGTTYFGGSSSDGTVFKIDAGTNTLTTLATFNGANGAHPLSALIADAAGNLYGTTELGGSSDNSGMGWGTVFELTNTGFVVPEPSSLALLACAMICIPRRRRR